MGLTHFLEHLRSPAAGRSRESPCCDLCVPVAARQSSPGTGTSRAHLLGVEHPYKGSFECPLSVFSLSPPGHKVEHSMFKPQACPHVPPSPVCRGHSWKESTKHHPAQQKMALDTPSAACRQNDKAVSCQQPKYSWFHQAAAQLRCGAGEEVLPSHFGLFLITFTRLRYQKCLHAAAQAATPACGLEKSGLKPPQLCENTEGMGST